MIISRLKLYNWKNFQNVEVKLSERNFIIGSNASGKSNLFDALRFLRDISKQAGGLQTAVSERGGIKKIRCLAARKRSDILIEVDLSDEKTDELLWTYSLDFMHTGGGVVKSEAKIVSEKVFSHKENKTNLYRDEHSKNEDAETLKFTHLEQITANKEFREIQTFFQNIEYLNVVPQLVRESSSYNSSKNYEDFYGRNFLERISTINEKTRNAYFKRINSVLKIAVPQLEELQFHKDSMGIPHLEAKYIHWRAKGSIQTEEQFSDGTLRLIGFLWALIDSNGTILLEEPEINLHSEIVKQFPEFISKIQRSKRSVKQVLIATHSYDLLNNPGIGPEEVLVLQNSAEGTIVKRINEIIEIKAIIDAGLSIAEATIPFTAPKNIQEINQLNLNFFEQ
jgi:predicted ATPase